MQSPSHNVTSGNPASAPASLPAMDSNANLLLRDFLQERWKGLTPILWGQQLKQERLDELIYLSLLNVDHLPIDTTNSPMTDFYEFDGNTSAVAENDHA